MKCFKSFFLWSQEETILNECFVLCSASYERKVLVVVSFMTHSFIPRSDDDDDDHEEMNKCIPSLHIQNCNFLFEKQEPPQLKLNET